MGSVTLDLHDVPAPEPPKFLTVPPRSRHTATVIFVHGLGDTGHGWKPVADMFRIDPDLSHIKWILPHSPIRAVQANMGMEMPSWFDIYSFGFDTTEDETGMVTSARAINALILSEISSSGLPPDRIVLGGFSQGATMSLLTGLTSQVQLAGVVVLSGWLAMRHRFAELASPHASSVPVFWGQGSLDPLVKLQFGRDSAEFLVNQLGMPLCQMTTCYGDNAPAVGNYTGSSSSRPNGRTNGNSRPNRRYTRASSSPLGRRTNASTISLSSSTPTTNPSRTSPPPTTARTTSSTTTNSNNRTPAPNPNSQASSSTSRNAPPAVDAEVKGACSDSDSEYSDMDLDSGSESSEDEERKSRSASGSGSRSSLSESEAEEEEVGESLFDTGSQRSSPRPEAVPLPVPRISATLPAAVENDEEDMSCSAGEQCKGLTLIIYDGLGHATSQKELDDVKEWIKQILPGEKMERPPPRRRR